MKNYVFTSGILISTKTNKEVSMKNGRYRIYRNGVEINIKKSKISNKIKNNYKNIKSVINIIRDKNKIFKMDF